MQTFTKWPAMSAVGQVAVELVSGEVFFFDHREVARVVVVRNDKKVTIHVAAMGDARGGAATGRTEEIGNP